ncbi:xanthine dehydrogenase accessory protein XdhC [Octadecabacter sp. 1_MG-2023]|uniref:xanthine dehydrogenase accessory protein XdhC n=1 Tax=unclassified Octadecabacter TaxID=196158 RepID=UPI001C0A663D|nr:MULTISPECIES: xanthine dehydrogenase accessory protein XdhC [unclassified Octadecabacter]MBU2991854.1 xanthine dehydrogenase accessory protein XdhC [Octadecabacter sp. B2R22]MDO6735828.1 xanthine dehydrogenase accessory protein XdhC [Octadecabacter sp. 1_MG-2023]
MNDFITVTVQGTKGSAPRDASTFMRVWADRQSGTIGGGALEWDAARIAREMLTSGGQNTTRTIPLGPDLGQCCGGTVTLAFNRTAPKQTFTEPPLWIWGAGHVGRAIANVIAPLEDRDITLIDTTPERMPDILAPTVSPLVAANPVLAVPHGPINADHLILTYSHDIDLALCDALLRHDFASVGLIGSATKWARFRSRLASMGHEAAQISRIACPIGDPALGKHPQAIAVGVAAALISTSARMAAKDRTG